jgi:predicted NAD-dependent protein-ADP-ribosyltransferase YbiA (DUF1768 family)
MAEVAELAEELVQEDMEGEVQEKASVVSEAEVEEEAQAQPKLAKKEKKEEKKEKKKRPEPIPKDSKSFFKARRRDVKRFDFTPDGDLQVPEIKGIPPKVIKLPFYTPVTEEQLQTIDDKRQVGIEAVELKYNEALKNLRQAINEWRESGMGTTVIQLQRELAKLEHERTVLRSPVRWIKTYKNPRVKDILFDMNFEDRKIGYDVTALGLRNYTTNELFTKSDVPPVKLQEAEEEEEVPILKKDIIPYIVFYDPSDPTNGFLAPDFPVQFVHNGTKYASALQAYEAERMTELKRLDLRKLVLLQKTGKGIRATGKKVVGQVENPVELWTKILKSLVAQHPKFGENLRTTDKDILVFADPLDGHAGIGLAANDPNVREESKWTGKNELGQAWMAIRAELPEGELEAQGGGAFMEDGTEVLQEAKEQQKRGVLIHRYKMQNGF